MGCWISTPEEGDNGGEKAYSLTTEDGKHKTSAWTKEFKESNWKGDTENIWGRKISDLSCHMDLPRLGVKMRIYNNGKLVGGKQTTKVAVVYEILSNLVEYLHETDEIMSATKEKFYDFVHQDGSGDISQQLLSFLNAHIPEQSKIQSVLCLCHQKIVFPAFYSMKSHIFDALSFRDARGSWVVSVYIEEDSCTVVHSKTQLAKEVAGEAEPEYSFTWELVLVLTGEKLQKLSDISLRVATITTRPDVPPARCDEIRNIIANHYEIGPYNENNNDDDDGDNNNNNNNNDE